MIDFSAKLNIFHVIDTGNNTVNMIANVIDNRGNFSANDVQLNDIVFVSDLIFSNRILRFKVININNVINAQIDFRLEFAMDEIFVLPKINQAACMGRPNEYQLISVVDSYMQAIDPYFVSEVRNYQNNYLVNIVAGMELEIGEDYLEKDVYDKDEDQHIDVDTLPILDDGTF